jgi:hypothetical protein
MADSRLDTIAALPGIWGVALCDDRGGILQTAGQCDQVGMEIAALGQGIQAAATELGRRLGLGGCDEIIQVHPAGRLRIRRAGPDRFLLIWHQTEVTPDELERVLPSVVAAEPPSNPRFSPPPPPTQPEWDPFAPPPPA